MADQQPLEPADQQPLEPAVQQPAEPADQQPAIVRMWTGVVRTADADDYARYVETTGMTAYRATPGNLDAWLLTRDLGDGRTEVTTVSRWRSLADITAFAGPDAEKAVFYPDDDRWLIERDERVRHYRQVGATPV